MGLRRNAVSVMAAVLLASGVGCTWAGGGAGPSLTPEMLSTLLSPDAAAENPFACERVVSNQWPQIQCSRREFQTAQAFSVVIAELRPLDETGIVPCTSERSLEPTSLFGPGGAVSEVSCRLDHRAFVLRVSHIEKLPADAPPVDIDILRIARQLARRVDSGG